MAIHLGKHTGTTGWITWENVAMILTWGLPQQDIHNKEKLINTWIIKTLKIYRREAMYDQRNTDTRSRNHSCRWKARSINYSECVPVVLVVQYKELMHSITHVLSCVTCPNAQYFPTLPQKVMIFRKKLSIKTRVFWFSVQFLFVTFLILWRIRWDMIIIYIGLHVK